MISSCTKHSRSAQRRPCRSFSSTACAVARAAISSAFSSLRHGGAENVLASGMLRGERVDRGGDPRGIETIVGLGPGLGHDAVHHLPRYRTAPTLSRDILRWQQIHAAFALACADSLRRSAPAVFPPPSVH